MNRRQFLGRSARLAGLAALFTGCQGTTGRVIRDDKRDMVGNTAAGAETFRPIVDECVGKLLARHCPPGATIGQPGAGGKRICFVGVENKGSEEIGDFKDQIVEVIDTRIVQSGVFQTVSRRVVDVGLRTTRLRPDDLLLPANRQAFQAVLQQQGQPFDYLLFANLTTGTTRSGGDAQRDYLLTLELVDVQSGTPSRESATIRKGYYKSLLGKMGA
jgi:hypothetical protein